MERSPKTLADAVHLLQVCELLASSTSAVVDEWLKESKDGTPGVLPSQRLHDAQRTILAITGSLTELVSEPHSRVIEVACQYWESRALSIAAERKIPDLLAVGGDKGMSAKELGAATGIEYRKLCMCTATCPHGCHRGESLQLDIERNVQLGFCAVSARFTSSVKWHRIASRTTLYPRV